MQVLTTAPSPHRYAARYNQLELFIELLERHANLNSYDAKRRTALHAAVKHRHHTIVRLLLRAGASVNVPTLDGAMTTPLHLAAMSGNLEMARLLLEAHADPALTNSDGENTAGVAAGHVEVQRLLYAPPPALRQGAACECSPRRPVCHRRRPRFVRELHASAHHGAPSPPHRYMHIADDAKGSGVRFPSAALVVAAARGDLATAQRLLRVRLIASDCV
jgi:hypothetical protein